MIMVKKENSIQIAHTKKKDLVSLADLSRDECISIFKTTMELKKAGHAQYKPVLQGKTLGMIFEKPSTRTSISFAAGMNQLGGLPLILSAHDLQLYRGESMTDTARVLSRYVDIIMIRANRHQSVMELASRADVPVINGLTDREHPCQVLADVFTIIEKKILSGTSGRKNKKAVTSDFWRKISFKNLKIAYVGDGNNIAHSWILAASILGMNVTISCPEGYDPDQHIWRQGMEKASLSGAHIELDRDPVSAVQGVDVVYTDVWTSMGKEKEKEERKNIFSPYQVNRQLVAHAKSNAIIMHCLPAHRGEEITDEILDGPHSAVFDQAENRLHIQKAIILKLLKAGR